jgi:ATP-dependent Clp protease ATP-binding subunit ClpC
MTTPWNTGLQQDPNEDPVERMIRDRERAENASRNLWGGQPQSAVPQRPVYQEPVEEPEEEGLISKDLLQFGRDLVQEVIEGATDPIIGRDKEIEQVVRILSRKTKNNPVLIGEPGVGKTAIVEGLAQRIVAGDVPECLKDKVIYSLDLGSLMAGASAQGELEKRAKFIFEELKEKDGQVLLFIDEIHNIIGLGAGNGVDIGNLMKPFLSRGKMSCIGATTLNEFRENVEKDSAFTRRFRSVMVEPPNVEDTIEILRGLKDSYEEFHGVTVEDSAIESAANLSHRYISERFLPDKAIDLVDEACATSRINDEDDKVITEEDIASVVSKWTGIPVTRMTEEEGAKILNLDQELHKRLIGQDEAVTLVSEAMIRSRSGIKDPKRPIGSFVYSLKACSTVKTTWFVSTCRNTWKSTL